MKKILFVEDEETIREFVVINLERAGYQVTAVASGEEGLEQFQKHNGGFDIALLDLMLPGIDGLEVCKTIRSQDDKIGIIMLTARTQEMDKVGGLMLGADDYITKPFSPSELVARIDAIHRRVTMASQKDQDNGLVSGPFVLDVKKHTVTKNSQMIDLTQVEFQILEYFLRNQDMALERSMILDAIWGKGYHGDIKIVDVNIRRLRMKIEEDPSNPSHLLTVWGYGYKWSDGR